MNTPTPTGSRWLAIANRILPPNAFYFEIPWRRRRNCAQKYVVISLLPISRRACRPSTARNVSIWARLRAAGRASRVCARDPAIAQASIPDRLRRRGADHSLTAMCGRWSPGLRRCGQALWTRALRETYARRTPRAKAPIGREQHRPLSDFERTIGG